MQLEARGIPVAMLTSDAFRRSVAEQLESIGFTAFEPVYVPHPIAGLPAEAVHGKADAASPEIVARLTGGPATAAEFAGPVGAAGAAVECEECAIDAVEQGL